MALVIRMRQQGASSRQKFRIVVTNERDPRDGKYVEMVGWYNPFGSSENNCFVNIERLQHWVDHGAQVSDRVKALVGRLAPEVVKQMTVKRVAKTEKRRQKRKASAKR